MTIPIDLRLSSYQVGTKANPRLVWCIGVSRSILRTIPEDQHKITVEQKDGQVTIYLGHDGVKLSSGGNGRFSYATQLGNHHLTGLTVPDRMSKATPMHGLFDERSMTIVLEEPLPAILKESFLDTTPYEEATNPGIHFPAQHFQEDVKTMEPKTLQEKFGLG